MPLTFFQEAAEHELDLSEYDPIVIKWLAGFLYTMNLPLIDTDLGLDWCNTALEVNVLADKYNMQGLKELADLRIKGAVEFWDIEDFLEAPAAIADIIKLAYDYGGIIGNVCHTMAESFVDKEVLAVEPGVDAYRDLLRDLPDFALDVARHGAKRLGKVRRVLPHRR